jgi:hypothetical protein
VLQEEDKAIIEISVDRHQHLVLSSLRCHLHLHSKIIPSIIRNSSRRIGWAVHLASELSGDHAAMESLSLQTNLLDIS